ncbi:leucyl-tRNA synthetase [Helicobacter mustelae]|nr:leucyl-tRNA synthetase [Helicobacter mustelae]
MEYQAQKIEAKWQEYWQAHGSFEPLDDTTLPKKYILSMFPYPSGALHMGHVRNYCIGDAMARHYRKQGFNVLHPIGFDAFGMPAENAAIKHGAHPKEWTYSNIEAMHKEFKSLGFSFSRERSFATCDPLYTKWEQEFFIDMWQKGLVYRKKAFLNWCPKDQTVLANEQVVDGKCWRCDTEIIQKEMVQYYIKITDYAEELLADLDKLEGKWPNAVLTMQRNWIGKSLGLEFALLLEKPLGEMLALEVFTTRPDTIYGVTYCAIAPEHPLVAGIFDQLESQKQQKIKDMQKMGARARAMGEKEGVDLGIFVLHPLTKKKIPVWVANFVLMDYGSGAVMGVPAHDERDFAFAKKYALPIKQVLKAEKLPFCEEGELIHSESFDGLHGTQAKEKIISYFESKHLGKKVMHFRLKDWGISRQRYWGAPIPLLHCEKCGIEPQSKEKLPITLPDDVVINGEGNPLDKHKTWQVDICPKCGGAARRETDTMDTFFQSSWYFLRYTTPRSLWVQCAFDERSTGYWLEVDEYIGGVEHAILHLLYARFFTKVLRDLGYIHFDEPFSNLLTQGMVLKEGRKMSKSLGNVIEPHAIIQKYGSDTARLFVLFAAPPAKELEWIDGGVEGAYRFIRKFYEKSQILSPLQKKPQIQTQNLSEPERLARKKVYEALQKSQDIFSKKQPGFAFNTLIAACMEAFNALSVQENLMIWSEGYYILSNVLEPMIPHVCWEISQKYFDFGNFTALELDEDALRSESVVMVITVNGKRRGQIQVSPNASKDEILDLARENAQKYLEGWRLSKKSSCPINW